MVAQLERLGGRSRRNSGSSLATEQVKGQPGLGESVSEQRNREASHSLVFLDDVDAFFLWALVLQV